MQASELTPARQPAAWIGLAATVVAQILVLVAEQASSGDWQWTWANVVALLPLIAGIITRHFVTPWPPGVPDPTPPPEPQPTPPPEE